MNNQILLNVIRSTQASMLAMDIIGVQPMSPPAGTIFNIFNRSSVSLSFNFDKRYYKYFLRLNNRREHQTEFDFEVAKYPYITIGLINQSLPYQKEWIEWMDINIGKYRYFRIRNKLYFDNKDLMALYYMRWT